MAAEEVLACHTHTHTGLQLKIPQQQSPHMVKLIRFQEILQYDSSAILTIFWLLMGQAEDRDGVSGLHGIMGNIYEGQHIMCIKVM